MIRDFARKNSVLTLAFLVAGLQAVDKQVIDFCLKKRPKALLNKMTNCSTIELHDFLMESKKIVDAMDTKELNKLLYQ